MPNLRALLEPRAIKTDIDLRSNEWAEIERICQKAGMWNHVGIADTSCIVLGDSHSLANYTGGDLVLRHDGLTLHGMLKRGVENMLDGIEPAFLTICVGNVDIRHHLGRHGDPWEDAKDLLFELKKQVDAIVRTGCHVRIVEVYPVEHEGRKIPKTGWYKGTPFFLPQAERASLASKWNGFLRGQFLGVERWPASWWKLPPEEYAQRYMEKPQSVHLSPAWHRWDYDNVRSNERLHKELTA